MADTPQQSDSEKDEESVVFENPEDADTAEPDTNASNRHAIELLLTQTRRSMRWHTYFEVGLWFAAAVAAFVFLTIALGLMVPDHSPAIVKWMAATGGFGVLIGLMWCGLLLWQTHPSLYEIAARLQSSTAEFRSDIVAALQFSEPDAELHHFSEELAQTHVARTARRLVEAKKQVGNLADLIPQRPLAPSLVALLAGVMLCSGLYVFRTADCEKMVVALWSDVKPSTHAEMAAKPIVGEIDVHYVFPPYSNRPTNYEAFTTGHIKTLVGTEVTLKTYALVEAHTFEVVWTSGEEEQAIEMSNASDHRLEVTMNITRSGTYTFRAITSDGSILEDPMTRTIEVEPDRPPDVVITSHQGEIEVSPGDQLEFKFTVSDDFGVETVSAVSHFAQDKENATRVAIDLPELIHVPNSVEGTTIFDLEPLQLQPKDVVVFTIEAGDNNSMTGPGVGKSLPIVLRVTSPEDKHQRLIAAQQDVLDALIDLLGSYLEAPLGERAFKKKKDLQIVGDEFTPSEFLKALTKFTQAHDAEAIVLQEMQNLTKELKDDPLLLKRDFQTFKGIYERLYRSHRDGAELITINTPKAKNNRLKQRQAQKVATFAAKHEHLLEGVVLAMEAALRQQKMDAIEDTAKEIRDLRDRLKELLLKYKETGDPELKKAIQREIQRLRQRMAELLSRMQTQMQNLPAEHLNMDAIEQAQMDSKTNDITADLQNIEDMLANDDIDGALKALDEMSKTLDELTKEMGSNFDQAEPSGLSAMDEKLNALMDKVNDVETAQRALEQETRKVQLAKENARNDSVEKLLEEGLKDVKKLVRKQREQLDKITNRKLPKHDSRGFEGVEQRFDQLNEAIKQRDVEQAYELSRELDQDLKSLQFSLELSERYARDKTKLRNNIKDTRSDLKSMVPRGKQISKALGKIIDQAGQSNSDLKSPKTGELRKRQKAIEKRADDLSKEIKDSAQQFPMLDGEVGKAIDGARDDMQKSGKGLKQNRVQRSLDFQRSALERLQSLKDSMKDALQKERNKDGKSRPNEKVAIPKKDSRDSLDIRQEVQKRMKDVRLENYDSEIERYYKSLTE